MVSSIGVAPTYTATPVRPPVTGLQAQVARYKKELSDCVNCASAKTPQGKANIEAILNKISVIQERIDNSHETQAQDAAQASPPSAHPTLGKRLDILV